MSIESRYGQYGKVFGHWHISSRVGSGEKSVVFRLVHSDDSSVTSAMKAICLIEERGQIAALTDSRRASYEQAKHACMEHARRELLHMNNVQGHTNVVGYLDHTFVDWEDDGSFGCDMLIRMDLLTDLRSQIDAGRQFSREEILNIGKDICNALILCHRKGILHQNIKPENIFFNADGNYKLGDCGISSVPASKARTLGYTPQYAAPEQIQGVRDERVDIYALGLVLYQLSNRNLLPFASSAYMSDEAVRQRQTAKYLPVPADADEALAAVILKACAHNPEERYRSAAKFLDALNKIAPAQKAPHEMFAEWQSKRNKTQPIAPPPAATQTKTTAHESRNTPSRKTEVPPVNTGSEVPTPGSRDTHYRKTGPVSSIQPERTVPAPGTYSTKPTDSAADKQEKHPLLLILSGLLALIILLITGYFTIHFWTDPTCTDAQTCRLCGTTRGLPAGHSWIDATCTQGKTCSICGRTVGSPAPHNWQGATCTLSDACAFCGTQIGEPLGHNWQAATYISARACSRCGITEGEPLPLLCIAAGVEHTVFLKPDGTVYACGANADGQCNVYYWSHVTSIYAGDHTTFGLTDDGLVYSAGSNSNGQINTSGWTNIVALAAGDRHTVGLTAQGSLVGTGLNHAGQLNLQGLYSGSEIVEIAAGYGHTVALHADGTVTAVGSNAYGQCDVDDWTGIVALVAGTHHTVGLKADGTVIATGNNTKGQCNIHGWRDIVRISAGDFFTVGIRADGTVVVVGDNHYENYNSSHWPNLDVSGWTDIVTVASGNGHMIGITAEGKLVATGNNLQGQCNVAGVS